MVLTEKNRQLMQSLFAQEASFNVNNTEHFID